MNADQYKQFEQMHRLCVHYEFEHAVSGYGDVDEDCGLAGCPSAVLGPAAP